MHDQKLDQVDEAKYLGVLLHKKLSWKSHVNAIAKKANQIRVFLQRNIKACHRDVKTSRVEYTSTVWDPVGECN